MHARWTKVLLQHFICWTNKNVFGRWRNCVHTHRHTLNITEALFYDQWRSCFSAIVDDVIRQFVINLILGVLKGKQHTFFSLISNDIGILRTFFHFTDSTQMAEYAEFSQIFLFFRLFRMEKKHQIRKMTKTGHVAIVTNNDCWAVFGSLVSPYQRSFYFYILFLRCGRRCMHDLSKDRKNGEMLVQRAIWPCCLYEWYKMLERCHQRWVGGLLTECYFIHDSIHLLILFACAFSLSINDAT